MLGQGNQFILTRAETKQNGCSHEFHEFDE